MRTIAERDGWRCHYCGRPLVPIDEVNSATADNDRPTFDHRLARCNGGAEAISNLVISCRECNEKKGCMSYEDFRWMKSD